MRQLILRPLLGSALLAAQTLLAGTVSAQSLDPELMDCFAHSMIIADVAVRDAQEISTPEMVDAAQQYRAFVEAMGVLLGEANQCETSTADMWAEVDAHRAGVVAAAQSRIEDGMTPEDSFAQIRTRLFACYDAIGDDAFQTAYTTFREDGIPCGWGE